MDPTKSAFTTGEVARLCSVSAPTVIRWIQEGRLSAFRVADNGGRRISRQSLLEFARRHTIALGPLFEGSSSTRLLAVTTDPGLERALRGTLTQQKGFELRVVAGAFEAGAAALLLRPHALLLDVEAAGIQPVRITQVVREQAELSHTKVVLFSPIQSREEAESLLVANADAYLEKPLDPDRLLARLGKFEFRGPLAAKPGS
ncbi:MAG: helix-turn-helix domain-containing protein [Planctomycetes bacterium]|nr:helix-turn-helix domain-containing protein [Planctomycetota bacterium]